MTTPEQQPEQQPNIVEATPVTPTMPQGISQVMRDAMRLRYEGKTLTQIGQALGICRQTVAKYLQRITDEAREQLELQTPLNLIAHEIESLNDLERRSRQCAEATKSDRMKSWHVQNALRACKQRVTLMLETGLIPREPERLYSVAVSMRPRDLKTQREHENGTPPTREELLSELVEKLKRAITL